jgi:signal peptidase I
MAVYFSIFLVIVTVITGIVWLADKFYLAAQRDLKLVDAQAQCETPLSEDVAAKLIEPSTLVDTSVQIFPVIAFVLILRSFIYEPFQIPSGSMMPTLLDGDFILVNKFNYGLRDPVLRHKFIEVGLPERGDVIVFKYPVQPEIDFIKRVVGLPGDKIVYRNKKLYIQAACQDSDKECSKFEQVIQELSSEDEAYGLRRYTAKMPNKTHDILIDDTVSAQQQAAYFCSVAGGNVCFQSGTKQDEFLVPKGHYLAFGDNRDNSSDGRFWGFIPEENLVGEAVAIWMSFDFDRPDDSFLPRWIPTGIRFSRIGGIE